ncbi:hypothetical protein NQ318_023233 [Aromia moschata]|uniref:MADF domain-containing protein n=1 Tax=Aromia moschata TaxID=1265417 RepID=A0AAV8XLE3_9CUCU|nr:hypothetical protein NQ318_023233 [Aromia moschata]
MATMNNEEVFQFIELYQAENCIWNPRNKHHKNKNLVNDAWKRISGIMGVPVHEVKKKKESLMTSFRGNSKNKLLSMKSGCGEDDAYKPIWIFYDAMEVFLRDIYESTSIMNSEEDVQSKSQREAVHDDEISHDEESSISSMQTNKNCSEAEDSTPPTSSQNRNLPNNKS